MMDMPAPEDRVVVLLDQPNGSTALLFDAKQGYVRTSPEYVQLFELAKSNGDVDARNAAFDDVLAALGDQGYFLFAMEYPGVPASNLGYEGGTISFDGDEWIVSSCLSTDLPIA